MTSKGSVAGRVEIGPSNSGRDVAGAGFWDHEGVEERLVDTFLAWRRTPTADARFCIAGRISSLWSRVIEDRALIDRDGADGEVEAPRPLPLSRADIARRDEASEWFAFIPERDRRLVTEVLAFRAKHEDKQVPWLKVWKRLGRGKPGPDGLRMRYSRAITAICNGLNASFPC